MTKLLFQIFLFSILLLLVAFPATGKEEEEEEYMFGKSINRKSMGLKKEKLSHFKFYWHDILSGSKPTSMMIIKPPMNTSSFGLMNMIDNPLTLGPKLSSKIVGRAQGLYASASQNDVGLMMVMNFAFIEGKYNGSTFTILGRNPVFEKVREMAVIGGSGLFRFSRGYVKATTHSWDSNTGDATVQYDAYVLHY